MGIFLVPERKNGSGPVFKKKSGKTGTGASVYRIIKAQFIATLIAFVSCLFFDWVAAYSVLCGGAVCVVPAAYAAWRMDRGTADPGVAVVSMLMAETGKLLLTVAMFIMVFALVKPLAVGWLFGTIAALYSFYILIPMTDKRAHKARMDEKADQTWPVIPN